jgi:formate C-acetyltransferase
MQIAQNLALKETFHREGLVEDDVYHVKTGKHIAKLKISKIQRTCVHDGPGIRTVVFFSGCNLRCLWCQNPELIPFQLDTANKAKYTLQEVMDIILKDKTYFLTSGGGVTLSGGEPLLQHTESMVNFLKILKKENIHITMETAAFASWKNIQPLLPYIDLFLVDIKVVNSDHHEQLTRQQNDIILQNIKKLVARKASIQFRMVVVPGYNDSDHQIKDVCDFLKPLGYHSIELLKFHNMYEEKSKRFNISNPTLNITNDQSLDAIRRAVALFQSLEMKVTCDLDFHTKKSTFSDRIMNIQKDIRESDIHLCFETSTLKTAFYKKHGFSKPTHIHRAERLSYLLNNKKVIIYPNELIVGNYTSKRLGGNVWEEYFGIVFVSILHQIHKQTPVSFKCSFADKVNFYTNIFPFWAKNSLISYKNKSLKDWMLLLARSSEMNTGFNNNQAAIAHFIVNHKRMLELGTTGIIEEIAFKRVKHPERSNFYDAAIIALKGLEKFASRYADQLDILSRNETNPARRQELENMANVCRYVPKYPARTFHEALQSMMFLQIALCTESFENAISFGRLDQVLYPYFKKDLEANTITYEKAKELLAAFILKVDEVILVNDGDTYLGIGRLFESLSTVQSVTFGGLKPDGTDGTNDVTYMLLDICELQPRGVNMTARIHNNSPEAYVDRIAEVYINGSPMPALYNDDIYVESLKAHYPASIEDVRDYSIVGCVEPVASDDHFANTDCANMNVSLPFLQALKGENYDLWIFGLSDQVSKLTRKFFRYNFNGLQKYTSNLSSTYKRVKNTINHIYQNVSSQAVPIYNSPKDMDTLLSRFQERLNHLAASILADHQDFERILQKRFTTPLASTLFSNCIETGIDVYEGGAKLNSSGIQAVAITDVADSLCAIEDIVFRKKQYTIDEVIFAIETNFDGKKNGEIREALLNVPKFGDDMSTNPQKWVNKVLEIYVNALKSVPSCPRNGVYAAGYYALNVNIVYGENCPALPSGRLKGTPFAHSIAPHYGKQSLDLVSALHSVSEVDFVRYAPNGTTITFTIDSALFQGAHGIKNLSAIIRSFFKKGGMQFQPNVINKDILLDAYHHPEKHPYLLVRIAGYCAYFNDLTDELKRAIINRTCYS